MSDYKLSGLIPDEMIEQVRTLYERIENDICVKLIIDDTEEAKNLKNVFSDLCSLSGKLSAEVYSKGENKALEREADVERIPTAALYKNGEYSGLKFSGAPLGYEFDSAMVALYSLGVNQELDENIKARLDKITKPIDIKIGVTLTCHFCPETVMAAQRLAAANDNITAEMIDVSHFYEFGQENSIMSVPALMINDSAPEFGAMSAEEILGLIEKV